MEDPPSSESRMGFVGSLTAGIGGHMRNPRVQAKPNVVSEGSTSDPSTTGTLASSLSNKGGHVRHVPAIATEAWS